MTASRSRDWDGPDFDPALGHAQTSRVPIDRRGHRPSTPQEARGAEPLRPERGPPAGSPAPTTEPHRELRAAEPRRASAHRNPAASVTREQVPFQGAENVRAGPTLGHPAAHALAAADATRARRLLLEPRPSLSHEPIHQLCIHRPSRGESTGPPPRRVRACPCPRSGTQAPASRLAVKGRRRRPRSGA